MTETEKGNAGVSSAIDPVCGMTVEKAGARFTASHAGRDHFFCSAGCQTKFQADPSAVLAGPPKLMGSRLVSIGMPAVKAAADTTTKAAPVVVAGRDSREYVCPMCAEVRRVGPGPCPKCGMALEPESPALAATEYTCPMHPEIVRTEAGNCPICGMALEPRTVSVAEEENPELSDMTRRFLVGVVLLAPLMAIAMGSMLWPGAFRGGEIDVHGGDTLALTPWSSILRWLELILATPVVLWCG